MRRAIFNTIHRRAIRTHISHLMLVASFCLAMCAAGCARPDEPDGFPAPADASLEPFQGELLDMAFDATSAMPLNPHIKNRSRAQEAVVTACLELKQPQRALRYVEQIENWRRQASYADLALFYAQHGLAHEVQTCLEQAAKIPDDAEDWQKDRIKVKIAMAHACMGHAKAAEEFEKGVGEAETGKVAKVEAMVCPDDSFDKQMEATAALISAGQFDVVRNALAVYAEWFNRAYEDLERRAHVEQRIKSSWNPMPLFIRIELLAQLADFALDHEDKAKALALLDEAKGMMDEADWPPPAEVPLLAQLAEFRFRAGDEERARTEIREAVSLFDVKRDQIVNIYRAETLRPVAEACWVMGDTTGALDLYARVLEAGVENPNSRPRAEDLAATCCSMALHAVDPGPQLWNRIREIRNGLGDPW